MLKKFLYPSVVQKRFLSKINRPRHSGVWAKEANDIKNVLCCGPVLHAIQTSNIFPDCKTFVDMDIKTSVPMVLNEWKNIENQFAGRAVPKSKLLKFLSEHFAAVDSESQLEKWVPTDWNPNPSLIDKISAPEYKHFAKELNTLWLKLARKMTSQVQSNKGRTSLIYVPHGLIVPGGRFRELYYWDTYFILLGLLVCNMIDTAKGLIENLLYILKNNGHIYNGSRIYYKFRSQPPLFLSMVNEYVKCTHDFSFIRENFKSLESEVLYWERDKTIDLTVRGEKYEVFRYFSSNPGPRPESYREDTAAAEFEKNEESKMYKYQAIASACESGWDFSSRWSKCAKNTFTDLHTHEILPVDLNAFMHMNYEFLKKWATELKMADEINKYTALSERQGKVVQDILWDDTDGMWYDVNLRDGSKKRDFVLSNFTPLWTRSFNKSKKPEIAGKMMEYYSRYGLGKFKGGLPTTMCFSGEQWDWPNAWAPLQLFVSEGFRNVGVPELAFNIANNWVNNNYTGYLKYSAIFEKYDCRRPGMTGFGGEYEEQIGFGWSNGVLLVFLNDYAEKLQPFSL